MNGRCSIKLMRWYQFCLPIINCRIFDCWKFVWSPSICRSQNLVSLFLENEVIQANVRSCILLHCQYHLFQTCLFWIHWICYDLQICHMRKMILLFPIGADVKVNIVLETNYKDDSGKGSPPVELKKKHTGSPSPWFYDGSDFVFISLLNHTLVARKWSAVVC